MKEENPSVPSEKWEEPEEAALPPGSADALSYLTRLTRQRLLTFEEEVELSARINREMLSSSS